MIEEIGKMIAIILGLLKKGEVKQAQNMYEVGLKRALNLGEDEMLELNVEQLKTIFEDKFGESYEGLEIVAALLSKGGDIHMKVNDDQRAERCYFKSLELYNLIELESQTFSLSRQADMSKVTQLLDQLK